MAPYNPKQLRETSPLTRSAIRAISLGAIVLAAMAGVSCRPSQGDQLVESWQRMFPAAKLSSAAWHRVAADVAAGGLPPKEVTHALLTDFCKASKTDACAKFINDDSAFFGGANENLTAHPEFRYYVRVAFLRDSREQLVREIIETTLALADITTASAQKQGAPLKQGTTSFSRARVKDGTPNTYSTRRTVSSTEIRLLTEGWASNPISIRYPDYTFEIIIPLASALAMGAASVETADRRFVGTELGRKVERGPTD